MKNKDINESELEKGKYCIKGHSGCFCKVGYPYERMCNDCRENRQEGDVNSFCVCPPSEIIKV